MVAFFFPIRSLLMRQWLRPSARLGLTLFGVGVFADSILMSESKVVVFVVGLELELFEVVFDPLPRGF